MYLQVWLSDIGIVAMVGLLTAWSMTFGVWHMLALYVAPLCVTNMWLVLYTWLQHTDVCVLPLSLLSFLSLFRILSFRNRWQWSGDDFESSSVLGLREFCVDYAGIKVDIETHVPAQTCSRILHICQFWLNCAACCGGVSHLTMADVCSNFLEI